MLIFAMRMLYSVTLPYFSRSNILNVNISKTVRASSKITKISLVTFKDFLFVPSFRKQYSVTLTYLSSSNISNVNISETMRASASMLRTTFTDFDIWHRMAIAMIPIAKVVVLDLDIELHFQGQNWKQSLSCFCRFSSNYASPAVQFLLYLQLKKNNL